MNHDVPILMLTARRESPTRCSGLESGADDYLTKPFGVRELVARVRALLRRRRAAVIGRRAPAVTWGAADVDPARRQARVDGREIELTAHEFDLLYVLASNRGIVFSRDALVQRVWGDDTHITERSVDTLVKRLRRRSRTMRPTRSSSSPCGAPATSSPMSERHLVSQPLLAHRARLRRAARGAAARAGGALPLADRPLRLSPRQRARPQQLADLVARELSEALTRIRPSTCSIVTARYGDVTQGFVMMRDGRRAINGQACCRRDSAACGTAARGPGGRPARRRFGDRDGSANDGAPASRRRSRAGLPRRGRRPSRPCAAGGGRGGPAVRHISPVVVGGTQVGLVAAPNGPPPIEVLLRELGPTLTWTGLGLLTAGSMMVALLIFRPARKRLRSLEEAARAVGEGRTVCAPTTAAATRSARSRTRSTTWRASSRRAPPRWRPRTRRGVSCLPTCRTS